MAEIKPTVIPQKLNDVKELQVFLATNYMKQIKNFFGNEQQAMKFLSSVMADVQRNPKLMECTPNSLINSYIMMAQLGFMPSGISGEAYVIGYNNSKKVGNTWVKVMEAQLQVGYQGFVTLFYKAGVEKINGAIVRKNDSTTLVNGELTHSVDLTLSAEERGEVIGAYVTVLFRGEKNTKYMNGKDIIAHAKNFSKSFDLTGANSPWNPANDPEGWMFLKTVLKQHAKLLPKNETINVAIALDNVDSRISDIKEKVAHGELTMGGFLENNNNAKKDTGDSQETNHEEASVQISEEGSGEDNKGFTDSIK